MVLIIVKYNFNNDQARKRANFFIRSIKSSPKSVVYVMTGVKIKYCQVPQLLPQPCHIFAVCKDEHSFCTDAARLSFWGTSWET